MTRRWILAALPGLLIASCGVPTPSSHSRADLARIEGPLPANRTQIFVHIPASMPALKATVLLDGRSVAQMPAGAFTKVNVSPGTHRIGLKYPPLLGRRCEDYVLPASPGTAYHLRLTDGGRNRAPASSISNEFLQTTAHFVPVSETTGLEMSRHETYSPAR